jgi:hypothetical protein
MSQPLKLGIFTTSYPGITSSGGIPTYTRALAAGMVGLGHDVHVLTLAPEGCGDETLVVDGVHLHLMSGGYLPLIERVAPGAWQAAVVSARARWLAERQQLDLFEFPNWEGMGSFYKVAGRRRPMVVRLHTSLREILETEGRPLGPKETFAARLEQRTCLSADALYVSTRAHRAFMAKEVGVPESRMSIVPLGVADIASRPAAEPRPRNADPIVLYLGRLETRKGSIELLDAARLVLQAMPKTRFVLIGRDRPHAPGGVTHEEWLRKSFPPEVIRQIEFLGVQDDASVARWFERADLFVAPSRYESFGLIFIEAMRAGLPVIGTRAGGIPEVVTPGRSGLLVDPQAPGQLAEAILAVLRDEPRRLELARGARAEYETRFSNRVMAERTAEHHRELLNGLARSPLARRGGAELAGGARL